jgi:hypothetical protein
MSQRLLPSLFVCLLTLPVAAQGGQGKPAQEPAGKPAAKGKIDFASQIWPILEERCIECHSTAKAGPDGKLKKPKGGVVLDTKDGITGSKKGKLIVAGKPDTSMLLASITLPADDEDRMPPAKKGDPLPKEKTDLIKAWIEEGAEFGEWTGKPPADAKDGKDGAKDGKGKPAEKPADKAGDKPKPKEPGGDPLVKLAKGLAPLPAATLAAFAPGPFVVASLGDGSPLLDVACAGNTDTLGDDAVAALAPLAQHIARLDLGRSQVTDAACTAIARMPRLVHLDLRQTGVGNQGIAALVANTELRSLNLFGTKAGDYGMAALGKLAHLRHLYVWQTDVSPQAVVRLRESLPQARVVFAAELPEPLAEGAGAARRRAR